jgi:hypothetical protein
MVSKRATSLVSLKIRKSRSQDGSRGKKPYWPDMILRRSIQPLAKKLGIAANKLFWL